MKPEVPSQVSVWENRYEEHVEKQLHNPFSEWSKGRPKKSVTSPTGEYSRSPRIYTSRSPSPSGELATTFSPQIKIGLLEPRSPNPFYQKTFNPLDHCPKPFYPTTFNPPEKEPPRNVIPVSPSPTRIHPPSRGHPPNFSNPPQDYGKGESEENVNFLSRVMKWRKPGTEIEDLVPLTKIPEPAKPPEPIKVNIPIPTPCEDPVSTSPFSPQGLSWSGGTEQNPCSSPRVEKPEIGNWSGQPENENVKYSPAVPFTLYEEAEVLPEWKPMGKTFADVIGGKKKIREGSKLQPVIDTPQYYTNQSQEDEYSDMNYRRENLSSQINQWQQRTMDHERKQLLNPFSGWDGASHHDKLSKTDAEYGKPIEGSMTELRGKKARDHISNEIAELCRVITDFGDRQPNNSVFIKFGNLFQVYTSISNKLVGMLMRARKQDLLHFEGEMLYQGRDNDVVIKLLKAAERQTTESAVGIKSGNRNEAGGFGGEPAEFKKSASGKEASATGYSTAEMMSKSESANSASTVMKKDSSICSSSTMNEESSMSMKEESLGNSKMMASSSNSSQVMSKEDGEFNTKMFAGSSNTSKMMSKEESSSSTKMLSESSSSMKMLKEEGSLSSQMLGEAVGDSAKMLAGVSISPSLTPAALMDSLKSAEIFNSTKMVPGEGSTSQQIMPCDLGAVSNMSSSEMVSSKQQASSSSSSSMMSSKQMSAASEQMSMAKTEQMTSAMENVSMSSAESNQMNMSSAQMTSATEQMSMSNKQMSVASEQMSTSNKKMSSATEQMSMASEQMSSSSQSTNEMMSNILDDSFSNIASPQGMTTSGSIQKTSQQSLSSKVLSKNVSSFESSDMALMDDTHSLLSSEIQDLKQLT